MITKFPSATQIVADPTEGIHVQEWDNGRMDRSCKLKKTNKKRAENISYLYLNLKRRHLHQKSNPIHTQQTYNKLDLIRHEQNSCFTVHER